MSFLIPTSLYLEIVGVSAGSSTHVTGGNIVSEESISLVLRADKRTNILLASGKRLEDVSVQVTLSSRWTKSSELDRDLTSEDVGFLVHTDGDRGEPMVLGGAVVRSTSLLTSLLSNSVTGRVKLVLPTIPFSDDERSPFIWTKGRSGMLRVSHITVSVVSSRSDAGRSSAA